MPPMLALCELFPLSVTQVQPVSLRPRASPQLRTHSHPCLTSYPVQSRAIRLPLLDTTENLPFREGQILWSFSFLLLIYFSVIDLLSSYQTVIYEAFTPFSLLRTHRCTSTHRTKGRDQSYFSNWQPKTCLTRHPSLPLTKSENLDPPYPSKYPLLLFSHQPYFMTPRY